MTDELTERVHGEVLAVYTDGYDREVSDIYAHAHRIIALVRADERRRVKEALLSEADGYIVAKGDDGEAEAAFATKPWMEQILGHIGLHGDGTGGQE